MTPPEKWPRSVRENFEERAAIKEYDGQMPRAEAKKQAYDEVVVATCQRMGQRCFCGGHR